MEITKQVSTLKEPIIKSIIAILVIAILIFLNDWVIESFIYYPIDPDKLGIITTFPKEQLFISIKIAVYLGIIFSFPYMYYQFWNYLKTRLSEDYKKATESIVLICSILFIIGILFGFFIVMPLVVTELLTFTQSSVIKPTCTITRYTGYLTFFTIFTGVLFHLPFLIYKLAKTGLLNSKIMRKNRLKVLVGIVILSILISPYPHENKIILTILFYSIYEICIMITAVVKNYSQTEPAR
jgi:sec-independent protein translocase protein TatC